MLEFNLNLSESYSLCVFRCENLEFFGLYERKTEFFRGKKTRFFEHKATKKQGCLPTHIDRT